MVVQEMTVWADRQIHLGTGANIKLGGSVRFTVSEGEKATDVFEATQLKVLGIVNRFAEQIENNVSMPDNWPDRAKKQGV